MNTAFIYVLGWVLLSPFLWAQVYLGRKVCKKWPRTRFGVFAFWAFLAAGVSGFAPAWIDFWTYAWLLPATIAALIVFVFGRLPKPAPVNASRRRLLEGALVAAPFAGAVYATFIERTACRVEEVQIPVVGLPDALSSLRIVQISDIHLGSFLSERELARMMDAARELKPDITLHTGDFISVKGDPLEASIRQAARIQATHGAFGCLGNHEIYADAEDEATRLAQRYGIEILRSKSRVLAVGDARLNLVGVDYQSFAKRAHYLESVKGMTVPGACNVLLSHNPDVLPTAARMGFDVTLGGHTHGGQVNVEILNKDYNPGRIYTPFVRGLYRTGGSAGYVTRGIGTIMFPARVNVPPEITLIRLVRA